MRSKAVAVASALAGTASIAQATNYNPPCPSVTVTGEICPTCPLKDCLAIETITANKQCPYPIPTTTTSYPCYQPRNKCPTGCASTSYVIVGPTPSYTKPSYTKPDYTPSPMPTQPTHVNPENPCPTLTHTRSVCSTCVRPLCITIQTLSL
ncbi:hypothetical protein CDD81_4746 [Ophiocordyceps australis]|uniref:Uncharacterized protein n=1 Tax=Ophiocordyceps australis TaxID=1399860 RepID=A0A2C5YAH5_9HYPO|nr:hypothetical protein CDD81_4746 [Ophiocordyceps australis]